jgi:hypothetical protein
MKTFLSVLLFVAALVCAQGPTWTTSTIQAYQGYDYELWNQNNSGTVKMEITGDNGSGANAKGGTFKATWSGTENVLFRSGKKWGASSTTTVSSIGNAVVDFAATWSSGDNVKMLGIYGWAYYPSGQSPTKTENGSNTNFSDQIEYYIIQDRGSYNAASSGTNAKKYGSATIDGIAYDFYVADRLNQPNLTGSGNFKQYFSVPASTGSHRTSGVVTVSKHFSEWERVGMKMSSCRLYEIAMKVESYTGSNKNSSGNATVTKNLLTIGGSLPSSGSGGGTSSSSNGTTASSSSNAAVQATTCKTPLITYPPSSVPSDPYTACFKHANNKCYVCKVESEGEFEGNMNTCASGWVWDGTQLESNLENGYWYQEVPCPTGSSSSVAAGSSSSNRSSSSAAVSSSSNRSSSSATIVSSSSNRSSSSATANRSSSSAVVNGNSSSSEELEGASSSSSSDEGEVSPIKAISSLPSAAFRVQAMSNGTLLVESHAKAAIYLFDTKGNMAQSVLVPAGSSIVKTSVPVGIYVVKNAANRQTQMVVVK